MLGRMLRVGLALASFSRTSLALDPFEIQVYDGTANDPGAPGLELHLNSVLSGVRRATRPELPAHHQSHATLEPSYGVLPWLEIGGYFQTTLRADGAFDYSGVKLRSKFVVPDGAFRNLRLGVNLEVSLLPERYEAGRWGAEVRPIVAFEDRRWLLAANPIFTFGLTDLHAGPDFEPSLMAKIKLLDTIALGVEYYAALGRMAELSPLAEQGHYIYEAVDLLFIPEVELNFGVGEGLTQASNDLTVKLILGYSWAR